MLEAAQQAFAQHGYERASVNHIIELAGSSKGSFYHHFDSKEAVFLELMDRRLQEQRDMLRSLLQGEQSLRLDDVLAQAIEGGFNVYRTQDWAPLYMEFWAYATRSPALRARVADLYQRWRAYLADVIAAAQATGVVSREVNPEKTAGMVIAIFEGMQLQLLIEEDVISPLDIAKLTLRMLRPTRAEREAAQT
ncbi:MAG: TetR family transcriptional regulator [Bacillota bacterium]